MISGDPADPRARALGAQNERQFHPGNNKSVVDWLGRGAAGSYWGPVEGQAKGIGEGGTGHFGEGIAENLKMLRLPCQGIL